NSCEGQIATQEITVFPRPVPQFGPMQNYYCSGDTVSFSNISFGGPMSSWFWDYGNGMTSTDSIPLEIIYFTDTIPSTYTVSLTATNDCGTETFTYEIVINPTDVFAFFNVNPISGCVGEEICLTNLSTLGANVLWDLGDGNTNTQNDICHTYSSAGTYTITLKAFGCGFDSITFDVTILPIPDAIFSNNSIVCPGGPLSFSNTSDNAVSFLWDFGDGNTSTLNNPTHTFVASGNYTVKLFATSNEGCVDSTFSSVTVLIPPVANFTVSTDSVCVGDFISFNSTSTPNPLTCLWSFGDGETSNDCNPTHSYDSVGNYIVTLIVTDNNDCGDTTQQLINVAIVPTPMFSFSQDGECSPVKIVFDNQTTNGESYEWSFGDGNTSTDETPTHTYLSGGDFPIQLIAINGVCSASTSQNILINQTPDAEIIAPLTQAGCVEFEAPFSSLPSGVNYTYKWDFGDGTFSFEAAPTHTFSSSGTFQVMLIAEDEPCVDTAFTEMIAFEPVETSVSTIDNPCYGDTIGKIDITVTNGTSDFQYQWAGGGVDSTNCDLSAGIYTITITDDNGCTWTEGIEIFQPENPISIDVVDEKIVTCYGGNDGSISIAADGGTPSYTYLWETGNITTDINNVPTGNYPITITDLNGCTLEESVVINQNDSISYKVIVDNISCFGAGDGQISFDSLSGGIPEYFITVPQLDSAQGTAFNGLLEGPYSVILTDAVGCVQTFTTTISEPPEVWIEVEQDTFEIILGETVAIESNHNVANPIFVWTPSRGLNCSGCEDPFARPFVTTTYEVLMTDENGCFALDTVFVDVEDIREIAIPNIFTPNNDGENDVFTLLGNNPAVTQVTEFRVFDRYGGILFKANDFELNDTTFGWDGKFRGIDAQVGTYIYTAKIEYIDGRIIDWSGSLMLIR
ncbi:MAG: gliding motility-associated-like protein, partial [Salibacteraceae bacterium]